MPRLAFVHHDDVPWREAKPQMHGDRKVAVHIKVIDDTGNRRVLYTRYDPGLVLERHSHMGDEVIHIMEGDVLVGDTPCRAGTTIILEQGASFGPLVAGPEGTLILEVFIGPNASQPVPTDHAEFARVLADKGIQRMPEPRFE